MFACANADHMPFIKFTNHCIKTWRIMLTNISLHTLYRSHKHCTFRPRHDFIPLQNTPCFATKFTTSFAELTQIWRKLQNRWQNTSISGKHPDSWWRTEVWQLYGSLEVLRNAWRQKYKWLHCWVCEVPQLTATLIKTAWLQQSSRCTIVKSLPNLPL